jgi:NTP pyrophosphatase (non-canonical NTP hydrolase)
MTTIAELLELQADFMKVLDIDQTSFTHGQNWTYLDAAIKGMASEAGEVLQETNFVTRPWDKTPFESRVNSICFESIDILFYLLEAFVLLGLDHEDVAEKYRKKMIYNLSRILRKIPNIESYWDAYRTKAAGPHLTSAVAGFDLLISLGAITTETNLLDWINSQTAPEKG